MAPATIDLMTAGKLVRLARRHSEYLLVMFMTTFFRDAYFYGYKNELAGIDASLVVGWLEDLPESMGKPAWRKRSYVNNLLARNEMNSNAPNSRHFLRRIDKGLYRIASSVAIRVRHHG